MTTSNAPYLRCLGQPALFTPSGEPVRLKTSKYLGLLVYLAVEAGRPHRRDWLAECFWPKASLSEARHSLSTALSALRLRLGQGVLEAGRDHVRIQPGRIALDLERLLAGDILGDQVTGPLEVAAFLDGFDLADSVEFAQWKDRQQARLLPAIKRALVLLMDQRRRMGDFREIEHLADRMLALDDLSEEAIRAKMEARAFAGDRIMGLRVFEEWKTKLDEELQASPSELLEGMAIRLRHRGWERTTASDIPTVPTDQWRGRAFIGRMAEYRMLYEAWEGTCRGKPRHVLLVGDSGTGKTTLVERLTTAAGLEGAAISRVQCYDLEREIPYSTLSALVHGLLDRPGAAGTPPEALAELSRTVPEVRRRFPTIPPSVEAQGETARIRLTEALLDMIAAITEEHPVILIVDDLHLADDATLAVLHLMMRRARGRPLMVVFLARPGELSQSPNAVRLRENAADLGITEIELHPMTPDESLELLQSLVPSDQPQPNSSVRQALLSAAAGFPMALELLVQDWQTSGDQSLALSVNAMTAELRSEGAAAPAYKPILQRIARLLDPTTQAVLNLAAILGHRLNDLSLYTIVDLSISQAMAGMVNLVNRRVLRDNGQELEFVNELIRGAAYLAVPPSVRRILHGQIADRFIQQEQATGTNLGLEIAWHCTRAGRSEEAAPFLLRGAREAMRRGAPYNAERALSTALPALADAERTTALLLLIESLQEQCRWEDSLEAIEQLASAPRLAQTEVAYVYKITARRLLGYYNIANLEEIFAQLVEFIRTSKDRRSKIKGAIEATSVVNTLRWDSSRDAQTLLENIEALVDHQLDEDDRAQLLLARGMVAYHLRDYDKAFEVAQTAIDILRRRGATNSVLAMLLNGIGAIQSLRGRYTAGADSLTQAAETALRIGNDRIYALAAGNLAITHMRLGKYHQAIQWAERSLSYRYELHPAALQGALLSYAMLECAEKVDATIETYSAKLREQNPTGVWQGWDLFCADSHVLLGRIKSAEHIARQAIGDHNGGPILEFCAGSYARWLARLSHVQGMDRDVRRALDSLVSRIHHYDALDQTEILLATTWLESRCGTISEELLQGARERLDKLPDGARDQLRRLGVLDHL